MAMRETKFRGKSIAITTGGIWVYGLLNYNSNLNCYTVDGSIVDINTVGQFSGLEDNEQAKVYEGDILADGFKRFIVRYGKYTYTPDLWNYSDHVGWYADELGKDDTDKLPLPYAVEMLDTIVIGDVTDNPELLR